MKRFYVWAAILPVLGFFVFPSAARADTMGQHVTFQVNPTYDFLGDSTLEATLRAVGAHGYFYLDDRQWSTMSASQQLQYAATLDQLANTYDTAIYPNETSFWGSEAKPGIDGDDRVTILLQRLQPGSGGYFDSINSYTRNRAPDSNEREMVVIAADSVVSGNAKNFLAHEFQHLISFNQKELQRNTTDDIWMNEIRSEYGITRSGFSDPYQGSALQRRVQTFLRTPSDSLVAWPNSSIDYGIASLFGHYLADRYGPEILQYTLRTREAGIAALDEWLSTTGKSERFPRIFSDWMVAAHENDPTLGSGYGYGRPGLSSMHVPLQQTAHVNATDTYTTSTNLEEWQPYWLELNMPSGMSSSPGLTVSVSAQGGAFWGGSYVATYSGGHRVAQPWFAIDRQGTISVPTRDGAGASLVSVVVSITQGREEAVHDRPISTLPVTINASLGTLIPTSQPEQIPSPSTTLKDGDLIRRPGGAEIYVIWGTYRRYLQNEVLKLYGFETRPVITVSDEVFNRYTTSNYIRSINGENVYAVWPDATKHWLHITPAQWDASGRDWNAIFIVNDAEVAFYAAGPDITQ